MINDIAVYQRVTSAFLTQQTSRHPGPGPQISCGCDALKVAQWRSEGYRAPQCSRQGDDSPSDTSVTVTARVKSLVKSFANDWVVVIKQYG